MYFSFRMRIIFTAVFVLFLGAAVFWFTVNSNRTEGEDTAMPANSEEGGGWVTYQNEEFGFAIDHPITWVVSAFPAGEIAPMFNISKPGQSIQFPLTHHSIATHVSVYPHGIPTEGVFGKTKTTGLNFSVTARQVIDFVLDNGEYWATYLNPVQNLSTWNSAGFVWGSVEIMELEAACFQGETEVSEAECDPFLGDQIVQRGSVSSDDTDAIQRIIESFHFLDETMVVDVVVDTPRPNSVVASPLLVEGAARGTWFFEASFPIRLLDANGEEVAVLPAQASGEWMTEVFVPFTVILVFEEPKTDTGFLILERSNPSGLPEYAGVVRIPVKFR